MSVRVKPGAAEVRAAAAGATDVDRAAHQATGLRRGADFDAGQVDLGASLTTGNHLLPDLLAELRRRHPKGRARLSLKNTEQVVADLTHFRIDLGFVEGLVQDERLTRYFWHRDHLCVFSAPDHPLATALATGNAFIDEALAEIDLSVASVANATGIVVACGEEALCVIELQHPGGRRTAPAQYLAAHPLAPAMRVTLPQPKVACWATGARSRCAGWMRHTTWSCGACK